MNFNENNFYEMQYMISENEIIRLFENTKYIENFYKIDYKLFVNIFQECNDITKKKLIEKIDINYLVLLVTNNFININRIWDNEIIFDDFNYTVEILKKNNLLRLALYDIKDYKFAKNVNNINYYNLYDVLISIKDNINKLKIFFNGINYVFLDLLISKMNDNMIKFLLKNINFLARLDLTGNLFTLNTTAQFNEIKISKLQIVLFH